MMQQSKHVNRVKLALVALLAAGFYAAAQERVEIVGISTPLSERPGTDDGAAFVVHFTGDMHGKLEDCG